MGLKTSILNLTSKASYLKGSAVAKVIVLDVFIHVPALCEWSLHVLRVSVLMGFVCCV